MKKRVDSNYLKFGSPSPPIPNNIKVNNIDGKNSSISSLTHPPSSKNSTHSNSSASTKLLIYEESLAVMPEWDKKKKIASTVIHWKNGQVSKPSRVILPKRPWNKIQMQFTKRPLKKQQKVLQRRKRDQIVEKDNRKPLSSQIKSTRNGLLVKATMY